MSPRDLRGRSASDPFARPVPGILLGMVGLGTALFAPLLPLGMAPIFIAGAVLAGGTVLWRCRRLPPLDRGLLLPLLLFWLAGGLSIAWTPVLIDGLAQTITFAYEFVPGILLIALTAGLEAERRRRIERWLLAGIAIGLAVYAVEVLAGQPLYSLGKLGDPTHIGRIRALNRPAVILAMLVWPAALLLHRRGFVRTAWLLPAGYFLLTLATPSASAVAGMLAGLVVLALALWSPAAARLLIGTVLVAGFVFGVPIAHGLYRAGVAEVEELPWSFRHRIKIWQYAADRVAENPLFGWGLDASRSFPAEGMEGLPLHPHNLFLQSLLELGVVGSALLLWFLLVLLDRTRRLGTAQPYALAAFASALIIANFAYGAWQTWWICSLLLTAFLLVLVAAGGAGAAGGVSAGAPGSRGPRP
ncbi:O-antigen ligase family protein [Rhodocista pekingensis]|uniref:O-antigen ligase family protein n=1 Tax=Rhodocista pekingensis TaxID=201185 RepID=A0ABW2KT60_9PROT